MKIITYAGLSRCIFAAFNPPSTTTAQRLSLAFLLLAVFLAGTVALWPGGTVQAQSDQPRITVEALTRPGTVPIGAAMIYRLNRSGDLTVSFNVKFETQNTEGAIGFGVNPTIETQYIPFGPGDEQVVVTTPAVGGANGAIGSMFAQVLPGSGYRIGAMGTNQSDVNLREATGDDAFFAIAAGEAIAEGGDAVFTLTRTGNTAAALTASVQMDDPGEAMLGNHWDEALIEEAHVGQAMFAASVTTVSLTFPTRPNIRDTGGLTLTASLVETENHWMVSPLQAQITVADDDTAPEVSLSISPGEIREGEDVTVTVTRHGDTSEAVDNIFYLRIGPSVNRTLLRGQREERKSYGITMAPGQETVDLDFTVYVDKVTSNFRYGAEIIPVRRVPRAHFGEYLKVRSDLSVSAAVEHQSPQEVAFLSVGSGIAGFHGIPGSSDWGHWHLNETFYEGQEVPFIVRRSGTQAQIGRELIVRVRYVEWFHPGRDIRHSDGEGYNPSSQYIYVTFPPGTTRAGGTFTSDVDDVDEPHQGHDQDFFILEFRSHTPYPGYVSTNPVGVIAGPDRHTIMSYLNDNPRAVSIAAPANGGTIEEGETAEFTLTRLGSTDGALTVKVLIDDPGDFRRGNHGFSDPGRYAAVTFEDGASTATLSAPTRDDARDIPDNTLTVTVLPSDDSSYRVAEESEGASSASVTVTDNDIAPVIRLTVSAASVVEGESAQFIVTRTGDSRNDLETPLRFGLRGEEPVNRVFGLGPGENSYTYPVPSEDDDYDDPDETVYEFNLLPLENVPEDEQSQYRTITGPRTATITITDNDLPMVGVEPVEDSYPENSSGEFRLTRVGQTSKALSIKAVLTETENSYIDLYNYLLDTERPYTFTVSQESRTELFFLQNQDGHEADGSLTFRLVPDDGYRIDPQHSEATFRVIERDPEPVLAVPGATAAESAGNVTFQVSLSSSLVPPSRQTVTVDYRTVDGTARAGQDYTAVSGTLTIAPRATSAEIAVPVLDNNLSEETETFSIVLSGPVNAVLQDDQAEMTAVATITDNEPLVTATANAAEVIEGNAMSFTFNRSGSDISVAEPLTVYFMAAYGDDRPEWLDIVIPAEESRQVWERDTENDDHDGPDLTYSILVIPPTWQGQPLYYSTDSALPHVTVKDDDLPVVTIDANDELRSEGEAAEFTLKREGLTGESLSVNVAVTQEGMFFASGSPPATATFAEGSATAALSVATIDDSTLEDHGSVTVAIAGGTEYRTGVPASAVVQVTDNDSPRPFISIQAENRAVNEGSQVVFTLVRYGGSNLDSLDVQVNVREYRNTTVWQGVPEKIAEFDNPHREIFSDVNQTVTFAARARTATLTIATESESYNDGDSYFRAQLLLSGQYVLASGTDLLQGEYIALVWVKDDDLPTITLSPPTLVHVENPDGIYSKFTAHRTGDLSTGFYFDYERAIALFYPAEIGGTVRQGPVLDTTGLNVILPGQASAEFVMFPNQVPVGGGTSYVEVVPRDCAELNLQCGMIPRYRVGDANSVLMTIYNNFQGIRLTGDQAEVNEGETARFTLTRYGGQPASHLNALTVLVQVTQDGEFIDGVPPQTVRFAGYPDVPSADAEDTVTLDIPTVNDELYEGDGAITVTVLPFDDSDPLSPGYELETGDPIVATVIVNDDDSLAVSIADATASEGDGSIEFTVAAPANSERMTVRWTTSDGTGDNAATAGGDYVAGTGVVAFEIGETSKTISVALEDDDRYEPDETFTVTLSGAIGAALGNAAATGTIQDDDVLPEVTVTPQSASVEEGGSASFIVRRDPSGGGDALPDGFTDAPLTVNLTFTQMGDFYKPPDSSPGDNEAVDPETGATTATIPAGQREYTALFETEDDSSEEADGSITIAIGEAAVYRIGGPGLATVNITDNDATISISDATVSEGASSMVFTISLSKALDQMVTVDAAAVDGTATSDSVVTATSLGQDFEHTSATITFAPGVTSAQFTVPLTEDTFDEEDETFTVELSNPSDNADVPAASATGTIEDNDARMLVGVHREGNVVNEGLPEGIDFRFELSAQENSTTTASERTTVVLWRLVPGTALPGEDYVPVGNPERTAMEPGVLSKTVIVHTADDLVFEEEFETFTFEITEAVLLGVDQEHDSLEVRIRDDDILRVNVFATSAHVSEGQRADFLIIPNNLYSVPVTISYVMSGTAGPYDYVPPPGTLTLTPAVNLAGSVAITTLRDNVLEPNETLELVITQATANGRAVGVPTHLESDRPYRYITTIRDGNTLAASVAAGEPANEGEDVNFTVRLSAAALEPVTVAWETGDGEGPSAATTDAGDYTQASSTVTIPAGDTSATIAVSTLEDYLPEETETFVVNLTSASRGAAELFVALGTDYAVGVILDDDVAPTAITLSVDPIAVREDAGETELSVTATFDGDGRLTRDVTVELTPKGSLAEDSPPGPFTLTILAGEASGSGVVRITPADDEIDDDVGARVRITGSADGFEVALARVSIVDDDDPPTHVVLTLSPTTVSEAIGTTDLTVMGTLSGGDLRAVDTVLNLRVSPETWLLRPLSQNRTVAAQHPDDYTFQSATLTIPAGESTGTTSLTFTAFDDTLAESDETAKVDGILTIFVPQGLQVVPARLTIRDDDQEPDRIELSASPDEVSEDDGTASINVTATLAGDGTRTADTVVTLSVHDVSAEVGQDYFPSDTDVVLTIPAGQMSVTGPLSLTLLDDYSYEGTEQFAIRGTNDDPGLVVVGLRISINDDETEPTQVSLTLDKDSVTEDGGSQQISVTATLQGDTKRVLPTQVSLSLEKGTAADSDYTAFANMLTIPAGEFAGRASVVVLPNDDSIDEPDETLEVQGSTPISGMAVESAVLTIIDNDEAGVTITPTKLVMDEGESGNYSVTLDTLPTGEVTVTVTDPTDNIDVTAGSGQPDFHDSQLEPASNSHRLCGSGTPTRWMSLQR